MRTLIVFLCFVVSLTYAQDKGEFLAVVVEGKEAFMSTQTGEVIFRKHAETDASAFDTDVNGTTTYIETKIHSVSKGETLSSIAKKRNTSIDKIRKDNGLKNSKLSIGQKLKIKKRLSVQSLQPKISGGEGRIVARLAPGQNPAMLNTPPPTEVPSAPIVSEVVKTEINEVSKADKDINLNAQENTMSDTETEATIYVVKAGDTLYGIAKKYSMTVEELKELNGLLLNNLSIGQKLKVK